MISSSLQIETYRVAQTAPTLGIMPKESNNTKFNTSSSLINNLPYQSEDPERKLFRQLKKALFDFFKSVSHSDQFTGEDMYSLFWAFTEKKQDQLRQLSRTYLLKYLDYSFLLMFNLLMFRTFTLHQYLQNKEFAQRMLDQTGVLIITDLGIDVEQALQRTLRSIVTDFPNAFSSEIKDKMWNDNYIPSDKEGFNSEHFALLSTGFILPPPPKGEKSAKSRVSVPYAGINQEYRKGSMFTQATTKTVVEAEILDIILEVTGHGDRGAYIDTDCVKLAISKKFTPTEVHYDGYNGAAVHPGSESGQLINTAIDTFAGFEEGHMQSLVTQKTKGKSQILNVVSRIQGMLNLDDRARLCCIPFTHNPLILLLLSLILEKELPLRGYVAIDNKDKELGEILSKYAVCPPFDSLILWRQRVLHFEGVENENSTSIVGNVSYCKMWGKKPKNIGRRFRFVCGASTSSGYVYDNDSRSMERIEVVSGGDRVNRAYGLLKGWQEFEFWAKHPLTFNRKSTQYHSNRKEPTDEEIEKATLIQRELDETSLEQKIEFISNSFTAEERRSMGLEF